MAFSDKKTTYTCYPEWGKYGLKLEYRPGGTSDRTGKQYSAQVLFSEVMRDGTARDGYRFTTRPLNDKQKSTFQYNPHASLAFDALPAMIAALYNLRQDWTDGDGSSVDVIPQAEDMRRSVNEQSDAIDMTQDIASMGEFAAPGHGRTQKKAPEPMPEGDDFDIPF
jgi:hypothetical protein